MVTLTKTDFKNKKKIREKFSGYISDFKVSSVYYSEDDIFNLVISALRVNEWDIYYIKKYGKREKYFVNTERINDWIEKKVVPNTVEIGLDDIDLLKLMIFSLAMPYKMLKGETRATMSEKTRRSKKRDFEQIFSDTFVGKIGEIAFRKFAKQKFGREINLDWEISTEISAFKSDIINSKEIVSIKSTDTLESIWAEAPTTAKWGIFVKVALPKDFFMKILANISSLKKLLEFVKTRMKDTLNENDDIIDLVRFIEEAAYEEKVTIKGYVCGFYKISEDTLKKEGEEIPYLGEVHGDKHLIECNKIMYSDKEWDEFFTKVL